MGFVVNHLVGVVRVGLGQRELPCVGERRFRSIENDGMAGRCRAGDRAVVLCEGGRAAMVQQGSKSE